MFSNNINITTSNKKFTYYFEYFDDKILYSNNFLSYLNNGSNCIVFNNTKYENLICNKNYWTNNSTENLTDNHIPNLINISSINVYFPTYSIETYTNGLKYSLNIKIWIDNVEVNLGNYLIDRFDSVACEKPKKFLNNIYYEKINVIIPDPYYIVYSDEWKEWRMYNIYKPKELETLNGVELQEFIYNYQETNDSSSNILL